MKTLLRLFSFFVLTTLAFAAPHFTSEGLEIDAGSLGTFTIEYPELTVADQKPAPKLHEKIPNGARATLKYEGGTQLDLALGENGKLTVKLIQLSPGVK